MLKLIKAQTCCTFPPPPLLISLLFFFRLFQARAMLGQSTWLRSKNTKPISAAMMIKPDRWSSRFPGTQRQRCSDENWSGRRSGRAGRSWSSHTASSSYPSHRRVFSQTASTNRPFPLFVLFFLACHLLDSDNLIWCQRVSQIFLTDLYCNIFSNWVKLMFFWFINQLEVWIKTTLPFDVCCCSSVLSWLKGLDHLNLLQM